MGESKRRKMSGDNFNSDKRRLDLESNFSSETLFLLMTHFPDASGLNDLSCDCCIDKRMGECDGRDLRGSDVIEKCFSEKKILVHYGSDF